MSALRALVLFLFFLSGACALVYEVVWARMMTHVFGSTALAVGTVLAAFMSGLALGSWLLGRLADRSAAPLRLYALLEVGVGVAALGAHALLDRIAPAYLSVYEAFGRSDAALALARFGLAFALVLFPTLLMGATLPVLARFVVTRLAVAGAELSTLYTANVVGAVCGVVLTGFHLIGSFGIHVTVTLAAAGNVAIGLVAWGASRLVQAPPPARPANEPEPERTLVGSRLHGFLLGGLAISGLTSFAYEVYWTRSLVFLLGNSTYAVSAMLTAFLSGLALGGFLVRFVVDRVRDRVLLFAWIQLLIGITASVSLPSLFSAFGPDEIRHQVDAAANAGGPQTALRFGFALLLMFVPASLIGATFPLVGRIGVVDVRRTASSVGRVYAANTAGNVAGALLPGLFLLDWLGIQGGIVAMAVLNAGVGLSIWIVRSRAGTGLRRWGWIAAAGTALLYAQVPLDFRFPSEAQTDRHEVLFYREGPSATTMVLRDPEWRSLVMSVDGIDIGGTTFTEYKQLLLAHLPKLLDDEVEGELSIGLGSGMLAGESARHRRVERITCVEIEPTVVEGAGHFASENHGVLHDPRIRIVVDDVATHLRTTEEVYDVVSADEKTAQEYASNGFSYSAEYYELLLDRLAEGGKVFQWVPTTLPSGSYRMVLKTFAEAFPHTQLWYFQPAFQDGAVNTVLVGSRRPVELDLEAVRRRLREAPEAFSSLRPYGLTTAESVLVHYVASGREVLEALSGTPVNTLVHPRYEFYEPSAFATPRLERHGRNHELLMELRGAAGPSSAVLGGEASPRWADALAAEELFLGGFEVALAGGAASDAFGRFEAAVERAPWNENLRARVSLAYREVGSGLREHGNPAAAVGFLSRAVEVHGANARARVELAQALRGVGQLEPAVQEARKALELSPDLLPPRRLLAEVLARQGRTQEAATHLRAILALEPADPQARAELSRL